MNIETLLENSYKNFHAKGLHYLCLGRGDNSTIKAYFFEGEVTATAEVVVPHNHRYHFITEVLAGQLLDKQYAEVPEKNSGMALRVAQKWDYMTPLNDGKGFEWQRETHLRWIGESEISKGEVLFSPANKIHTIAVKPDTVLLLTQLRDIVPIDKPTAAYSFGSKEQKPDTSGLYEKFDREEFINYLRKLEELGVKIG